MSDDDIHAQAHKYFIHPKKPGLICVPVADIDMEGMFCFFAQFTPEIDDPDEWNVLFPDLPGCLTCGKGLKQAMANAMDALEGWILVAKAHGMEIPEPSDINTARMKAALEKAADGDAIGQESLFLLVPTWVAEN